jgi:hypothetical protein
MSSSTKDVEVAVADDGARNSNRSSQSDGGTAKLKKAASKGGGLFYRPSSAKKGHTTDHLADTLDKSRFKNDPRLPAIKQEVHQMDLDGDGHLDEEEVAAYILEKLDSEEDHRKAEKKAKNLGRLLIAAGFVMLVFLGMNMGLTAAVIYLAKETKIEETGTMLTKSGTLVEIGQQRTVLPLSSMLYLPRVYRNQLEHLTVKLAG